MYRLAIAIATIIASIPGYEKLMNEMLRQRFVEIPAVTIFALAPNRVPFPPRQAPKLRAHARVLRGRVSGSSLAKIFNTGIMVAVYGILSKNAEVKAETHNSKVIATGSCNPKR